jgi:hypothetical protein
MIARKNRYRIALSKTGRAACRGCRTPIPKHHVCLRIDAFVKAGRRTPLYRCLSCLTPDFVTAVLHTHKRAERVPVDTDVSEEDAVFVCKLLKPA